MSKQDDHLKDYLHGLKRARHRSDMELLGRTSNWRELAQRELERRAEEVMRMFNDEVIEAIANGEVDVNVAIAEILAAK